MSAHSEITFEWHIVDSCDIGNSNYIGNSHYIGIRVPFWMHRNPLVDISVHLLGASQRMGRVIEGL